jgi:UPF0148 protein
VEKDVVKKIAQLVRAGATLTSYTCPACGTVLVRLKTGELYCANCERAVVLVKTEEEAQQALEMIQLREVRLSASEMMDHLRSMSLLLDIYERLSRVHVETAKTQTGSS